MKKFAALIVGSLLSLNSLAAGPAAQQFLGRYEAVEGCGQLTALNINLEGERFIQAEAEPASLNNIYFDQEVDLERLRQAHECADGFGGNFRDQCVSQIRNNILTKKSRFCFLGCDDWKTRFEIRRLEGDRFQVTHSYHTCVMRKVL